MANGNCVRTWKVFAVPIAYSKYVVMVTVMVTILFCVNIFYIYIVVTVSTGIEDMCGCALS